MAAAVLFVTELFERSSMIILLQKIDHASGSDAVDKTLNHGSLLLTVSDEMKMIRHDHVSKNEEAARFPRFIYGGTGDQFQSVEAKDGQAIFCYRGQVISG